MTEEQEVKMLGSLIRLSEAVAILTKQVDRLTSFALETSRELEATKECLGIDPDWGKP